MMIRQVALMTRGLLLVIVFLWEVVLYPGEVRYKRLWLGQQLRMNIEQWSWALAR
jgi:hypothetical protein